MDAGQLAIDLPDGTMLLVTDPELGDEQARAVRRELRLWARSVDRPTLEATRSIDAGSAVEVVGALGQLIVAGVVGNAAWAAFPKSAALLERVMRRGRIEDAAELGRRLRAVLADGSIQSLAFELVEATRVSDEGWTAVVRLDDRLVAVATDPSGDIVIWKRLADAS